MFTEDDLAILELSPTLREAVEEGEWTYLRALFVRQARRAPTPEEQEALMRRARELGPDGALGAVLELHGEALAAWVLGQEGATSRER